MARRWAYVECKWLARSMGQDELTGVAQDLFVANQVDGWWDNLELNI